MNEILQQISNNPLIVIVTQVATIIALVIAIVVPLLQKKRKVLGYNTRTTEVDTSLLNEDKELYAYCQERGIDRFAITSVQILNYGNTIIEEKDVYKDHELNIAPTKEEVSVFHSDVVKQSNDTIGCSVNPNNNSVKLHFKAFEKNDYVYVNILHTGDYFTDFRLNGKIKEGQISYYDIEDKKYICGIIMLMIFFCWAIAFFVANFLSGTPYVPKAVSLLLAIVYLLWLIDTAEQLIHRIRHIRYKNN